MHTLRRIHAWWNDAPLAHASVLFLLLFGVCCAVGYEALMYEERKVHTRYLVREISARLDWAGTVKDEFAFRCQAEAAARIHRLLHARGALHIGGDGTVIAEVMNEADNVASKVSTSTRDRIIAEAVGRVVARFPRYTLGCPWPRQLEPIIIDYSGTRNRNLAHPNAYVRVRCATVPEGGNMFIYCDGEEYKRGLWSLHKGWW